MLIKGNASFPEISTIHKLTIFQTYFSLQTNSKRNLYELKSIKHITGLSYTSHWIFLNYPMFNFGTGIINLLILGGQQMSRMLHATCMNSLLVSRSGHHK